VQYKLAQYFCYIEM